MWKNTYRLDWIVPVAVRHQIRKTISIFFVSFWLHHLIDSFKWLVRMLVANSNVGYLDGLVLPWKWNILIFDPWYHRWGKLQLLPKAQGIQVRLYAQNSHKNIQVHLLIQKCLFFASQTWKMCKQFFCLSSEKTSESENGHLCKTSTFQTLTISGRQRRQGKGEILRPWMRKHRDLAKD